jgi:hypothetical protein
MIENVSIKVETVVRKLADIYGLVIPPKGHKFTYVLTMCRGERVSNPSLSDVIETFLDGFVETQDDYDKKDFVVGVRFNVRRWPVKYRKA